MGDYTGIRGTIQLNDSPEAKAIDAYLNDDELHDWLNHDATIWEYVASNSKNPSIIKWSKESRASFIPYGALSYMPSDWTKIHEVVDGEFRLSCSLKNYNDEIDMFIEILPVIAVSWRLETYDEVTGKSTLYVKENGE